MIAWAASRNRCPLCSARSFAARVERSTARCFQAGSSVSVLTTGSVFWAMGEPYCTVPVGGLPWLSISWATREHDFQSWACYSCRYLSRHTGGVRRRGEAGFQEARLRHITGERAVAPSVPFAEVPRPRGGPAGRGAPPPAPPAPPPPWPAASRDRPWRLAESLQRPQGRRESRPA